MTQVKIIFNPVDEADVFEAARAINGILETFGNYSVLISKTEIAQTAENTGTEPVGQTSVSTEVQETATPAEQPTDAAAPAPAA